VGSEVILTNPLPNKLTSYRRNRTLHGRTIYRPVNVEGHNCYKGFSHPGTGDALDVFAPAGTPVKAMHAGRVTHIGEREGAKCVVYIEGVQDTVDVVTVYAHLHLKDSLHEGSAVISGLVIGYVGKLVKDPHLHLEVWIDGHSISGKTPTALAKKIGAMIV
jgi:murein DD-endopeptidase MepM/ murein hydrolase activator NlpD